MKYFLNITIALLICFGSTGCGNEQITYIQYKDLPKEVWNWDDALFFEYTIEDSLFTYNGELNVRVTDDFPKSNIYIQSQTISPSGDTTHQLHNLILCSPEGVTTGKRSGKLMNCGGTVFTNRTLQNGTYKVKLTQHTRVFDLKGVNAIGLTIAKGDPVF